MNYSSRLEKLRKKLKKISCECFLIEHPTDILYLSGINLSAGKLLITESKADLFVDGRYIEKSSEQTLYRSHLINENFLKSFVKDNAIQQIGFDQNQTSFNRYQQLIELANQIRSDNFLLEILPFESVALQLRLIKDENEISILREAAKLGYQGYQWLISQLREGISEDELALDLEFYWKKKGASKLAFDSIIAFGANSSLPHYRAGKTILKKNTSVLIDIGLVLSHYHSDMTRTLFFDTPSPIMNEIYLIVEEAKSIALDLCKSGTRIGDLDKAARSFIASKGYEEYFLHSLGHGIGLDIHEPPTIREGNVYSNELLKPGMVITIEPGIYLPKIGGVRLEDTIVITEQGYENLTK